MKNKSLLLLLAAVILLGAYAIYLNANDAPTSKLKPNSDFAIENTNEVDKIIIRDNDGTEITLTKKGNEWIGNDSFKARPENIELIFKTLSRIKVQSGVPKNQVNSVIADIAARNKKVQIFTGSDEPVKTYYIGNATSDHFGTYMLLETKKEGRSSIPYITHIPGFNGFLDSRFFAHEIDWKFTGVFNYEIKDLAKIKVEFKNNPNESYQILQSKEGEFSLLGLNGELVDNFNKNMVQSYVLNYKKIHYNRIMDYTPNQIDSVKLLKPDYVISVTTKDDTKNEVLFYKKAGLKGEVDPVTKKAQEFDVNYALGCVNDSEDIARYQYHVIDKLLMRKSFFLNR